MRGQMGRGSALILSIIIIVIILVGYSYFFYHNFTSGFFNFISIFETYPINGILLLIIGFLIGYFQGKAF
ncbi:hypothetical protein MJ1_0296 [Nanobdella aerobiophila]|uniref:Uncharacterized protein n=1 Tax=Nanobdella aerobiophila TaxID=2586965 RepID=A0A915SFK9_9ARCH|nr:hypothetical protein [Nanobdella aerobiophila]BBL45464.1 hypothetical protein MJ1_0296 [Nanobdella aerobiophila]